MDPQQRLLLEVAGRRSSTPGRRPDRLAGSRTGVFVGMATSDYAQLHAQRPATSTGSTPTTPPASPTASRPAGCRTSSACRGRASRVDTACSSSLVAVHLACRACAPASALALAGGVNLMLVARERRSRFSKYADDRAGRPLQDVRRRRRRLRAGEGCGVVVLKRLRDALADGDRVLAVIRGSAVNQDGASSGLTAPNGPAQEAVIREALADAGVTAGGRRLRRGARHRHGARRPDRGPGARRRPRGQGAPATRPLLVGSVKTNIGHLEAAAGIAGLIKVVLVLQHEACRRTSTSNGPTRTSRGTSSPSRWSTARRRGRRAAAAAWRA